MDGSARRDQPLEGAWCRPRGDEQCRQVLDVESSSDGAVMPASRVAIDDCWRIRGGLQVDEPVGVDLAVVGVVLGVAAAGDGDLAVVGVVLGVAAAVGR